jgi:hypothetical protein
MKPSRDIGALIDIMAALRTPGTGCPWDLVEQSFATIAPYTVEEETMRMRSARKSGIFCSPSSISPAT